jgi:hypothetical protein
MTGYQSKRAAARDKLDSMEHEALKLALKVLEDLPGFRADIDNVITTIKEALAQPAQEPVAWMWRCKPYYDYPAWEVSLKRPADSGRDGNKKTDGYEDVPLYTTPPQPAQEPVAWHSIETMYPQGEMLDIRMGNGSILCDVWPQSDGDLWWEGSGTGEKFIDPKYANVTHWRVHSDTTSPQRPWVGLTAEEAAECWTTSATQTWKNFEAKLKEKNT